MSQEGSSSGQKVSATPVRKDRVIDQSEARRTAADIRAEIHRRVADFDVRLAELRRQEDEIWFEAEQKVAELRHQRAQEADELRDEIDQLEERARESESTYERQTTRRRASYEPLRSDVRSGRNELADVLRDLPEVIPMQIETFGYLGGRLIDALLDPIRGDRPYGRTGRPSVTEDVVAPLRD